MNTNEYYCFNEKGNSHLPSNSELTELWNNGIKPIIFIDSCVCLHITKLIDHKKNARGINKVRIFNLKDYLSKHQVKINPMFGLMELAKKTQSSTKQNFGIYMEELIFFNRFPKRI